MAETAPVVRVVRKPDKDSACPYVEVDAETYDKKTHGALYEGPDFEGEPSPDPTA